MLFLFCHVTWLDHVVLLIVDFFGAPKSSYVINFPSSVAKDFLKEDILWFKLVI